MSLYFRFNASEVFEPAPMVPKVAFDAMSVKATRAQAAAVRYKIALEANIGRGLPTCEQPTTLCAECDHHWVDADNPSVQGVAVCLDCRAIASKASIGMSAIHSELIECGCTFHDGNYSYPCRSCGKDTELPEPDRFDPSTHYCGGSPWCLP